LGSSSIVLAASGASPALARKKKKGLHHCKPLIVWRARQDSNPRPPGS
jgi:hypothetical protein